MKVIQTAGAPKPGYYNQGVVVDPEDHFILFLAGQTGNMPGTAVEPVVDGGMYPQTFRALENLLAVVKAAEGNANHFVSLNVFLKDSGNNAGRAESRKLFGQAYQAFFEHKGVPRERIPARTLVWVAEVPLEYPVEDTLVEINGFAAIPRQK